MLEREGTTIDYTKCKETPGYVQSDEFVKEKKSCIEGGY